MAFAPSLNEDDCTGCGECVEVCPVEIFEIQDGKAIFHNPDECLGCESCIEVCDQDAVIMEEL